MKIYFFLSENDVECQYWALQGNGFCDDVSNTIACNFDGGDCCGIVKKGTCVECQCKQESEGK